MSFHSQGVQLILRKKTQLRNGLSKQVFGLIAKHLHKLTNKDDKFKWTDECQVAFDKLKLALKSASRFTIPDFNDPLILDTDAIQPLELCFRKIKEELRKLLHIGAELFSKSDRKYWGNNEGQSKNTKTFVVAMLFNVILLLTLVHIIKQLLYNKLKS